MRTQRYCITPLEKQPFVKSWASLQGCFVRSQRGNSRYRIPSYALAHQVSVYFIDLERIVERHSTMAKNGKEQKQEFRGWVNIPLNDQDKDAIKAASEADDVLEKVWELFASLVYQGWKVSVSWDGYSSAYQVALFCWDVESKDHGFAFSSRHPDLTLALVTEAWKYTEIAEGEISSFSDRPTVDSWA